MLTDVEDNDFMEDGKVEEGAEFKLPSKKRVIKAGGKKFSVNGKSTDKSKSKQNKK